MSSLRRTTVHLASLALLGAHLCACAGTEDDADVAAGASAATHERTCPSTAAGYPLEGFPDCATKKRVHDAASMLPSGLSSLTKVDAIVYRADAKNAMYQRGPRELVLNSQVFVDRSEAYVLAHELAHAWSATNGTNTYLGRDDSRFVGPDFAKKGWGGYEQCFPCDAATKDITKCYAAGNGLAALSAGFTPGPEAWATKMVQFDEDFAETVAAWAGMRPGTVWMTAALASCTPTRRNAWLDERL